MPTVNPLLPTNSSVSGLNPDGAQASGDGDDVDGAQAAQHLAAAGAIQSPSVVSPISTSSFEAVKSAGTSNVLSTPPPVEGGGRTSPINVAEAIGRMRQLQSGVHPLLQALVRSSEDGNAPAVPQRATAATSRAATVGAAATQAAVAVNAANGSASSGASKPATTVGDAATATDLATGNPTTGSMGAVAQQINSDVSGASSDTVTAAAQIQTDDSVAKSHKCNKADTYPGEKQLQTTLRGMGLSQTEASTLSKLLNDADTTESHSPGEETLLASAIATYKKLGESDPKHHDTASQQIVTNLKIAAANYDNSTTNKAASYDQGDSNQAAVKAAADASGISGAGTADGAYTTAMNALQSYVVQGSNNAALTALTTPPAAAPTLQPYNWVVE